MKVKNYVLDENLIIELGKFTILWNYFEKYFCDYNCSSSKLKKIYQRIDLNKEKMCNFAKTLNNRRNYFNMLITDYVNEGLFPPGSRNSSDKDKQIMKEFLKQENHSSKLGCLLIILRIRNNMMHGLKQIEDLNEQYDLFVSVNEVLESIKELNVSE